MSVLPVIAPWDSTDHTCVFLHPFVPETQHCSSSHHFNYFNELNLKRISSNMLVANPLYLTVLSPISFGANKRRGSGHGPSVFNY